MYVVSGYWMYGCVIPETDTLKVRLAPIPDAPDVYIKLVGLDPSKWKGLFVSLDARA